MLPTNERGGGEAERDRRKLYYGWVVVAAATVLMLTVGNFQYIFGVFVIPLIDNFGWSRASISWSVTIRNIITGSTSPLTGALSDRFGPRKFIIAGVFVVGLSYLLVSRVTSLWELYLSLGLLTGIGLSLLFVPLVSTANRWFGGRSALANGIVYSGLGLVQVVLPPIVTVVILRYSWQACFMGMAALAWIAGGIAWYFVKPAPPEAANWSPEGNARRPAAGEAGIRSTEKTWTLATAVRTRILWNLFFVYMITVSGYQIVMIHGVAAAIDYGITPEAAAVILTVSGITNTTGRLVISTLASKIGTKKVMVVSLAIQVFLMLSLTRTENLVGLCVIAGTYGLVYGGIPPMIPTISGGYFGVKSLGAILGFVFFASTIGAAMGPLAAGYIFDATGKYYLAFITFAVAIFVAFLLSLFLNPPERKTVSSHI